MTADEWLFFDRWPQLVPLYEKLSDGLRRTYPDMTIKVSKTQISFCSRRMFAMVSLPEKRKKEWPREFLMVSFGLDYPLENSRVAARAEPYPDRWTHHVIVEHMEDLDGELLGWIDAAHRFAQGK